MRRRGALPFSGFANRRVSFGNSCLPVDLQKEIVKGGDENQNAGATAVTAEDAAIGGSNCCKNPGSREGMDKKQTSVGASA